MVNGETHRDNPVQERSGEGTEIRHPDGRIEHPDVPYERKDIRYGCILALVIVGVAVFATHYVGTWLYLELRRQAEQEENRSPYPLQQAPARQLPRKPRLEQIDRMERIESADVEKRLAAKEKVLHSYGPSGEAGIVRIPIDEAIKLVAGKLPVAKQSPGHDAKDSGLMDAGESNSGRMFRGGQP